LQKVLGRLSLTLSPFVKDWLEEALEELSHTPESSPSVEEIKFLVIFFVLLTREFIGIITESSLKFELIINFHYFCL
jgi:hypothetical protein